MKLEDLSQIWGISVVSLKEYSKSYRIKSILLYLLDILVMSSLVFIMYKQGSNFQVYIFVLILVCIVFTLWLNTVLNPNKWQAFKFYKRNRKHKVNILKININDDTLYNVLYCVGYKRLKLNKGLDFYKELILVNCCENYRNSKKVLKYLQKYISDDGDTSIYTLEVNGKDTYFIGFIEDNTESIQDVTDESKSDVDSNNINVDERSSDNE